MFGNFKQGKPSKLYTFGKSRAEVLGAMFSIISLWIITGLLERLCFFRTYVYYIITIVLEHDSLGKHDNYIPLDWVNKSVWIQQYYSRNIWEFRPFNNLFQAQKSVFDFVGNFPAYKSGREHKRRCNDLYCGSCYRIQYYTWWYTSLFGFSTYAFSREKFNFSSSKIFDIKFITVQSFAIIK